LKASDTVFLFGLGGLGFNGLQIIRSIGARVIVSDIREERLEAAERLGVPRKDIVPIGKAIQDFVRENSLRIDTTFDFVGVKQTFDDAQQIGQLPTCISEVTDLLT
jgi:alcohol dehydrogenase, propanol-preferring